MAELRFKHRNPGRFPAWNGPVIHGTQGTLSGKTGATPIGSPAPCPSARQGVTGHLSAIPLSSGSLYNVPPAAWFSITSLLRCFSGNGAADTPCPAAVLAAFGFPGLLAL